ncbi:MAG: hypothetical protein FWE62_02875 [Firmicutes bacterium]|nr:hypothetical protein [Bacillota bacterium]
MVKGTSRFKRGYVAALAAVFCILFTGVVFAAATGQLDATTEVTLLPPNDSFRIVDDGIVVPQGKASRKFDETSGGIVYEETIVTDDVILSFKVVLFGPGDSRIIHCRLENGTNKTVTVHGWTTTPPTTPTREIPNSQPSPAVIEVDWPDNVTNITMNPGDVYPARASGDFLYITISWPGQLALPGNAAADAALKANNGRYTVSGKIDYTIQP